MGSLLAALGPALESLHSGGLNRWGVVGAEAYDDNASEGLGTADLAPWSRSILVLASGGPALWADMLEAMHLDPRRLTDEAHPLDAHVTRLTDAAPMGGIRHQWFLATATAPVQLDFRTLAVLAGIGSPSRLGLVIDPELGPWMGLRAACFVDVLLPASSPAPDVCDGCSAPCMGACPAGALSSGQWDVTTCASYHRDSTDCAQTCHSRMACPVGVSHRYSDLERVYHYDRAAGRVALRAALGIKDGDDRFSGVGPHWGDWDQT
jgi:hypothetical protein